MSSGALLAIGIAVLVILAVALLVGAARRRDTGEAIGTLSRETAKRDKSKSPIVAAEPAPSGRDLERSVALERVEPSKELAATGAGTVAPWTPPDPEVIGVTRRQF